jgi:hypothetical protein
MMRADSATVEWEPAKKRWEAHIIVGAEVIKRPIPKTVAESGEAALRNQAIQTAKDDGYELDVADVTVVQSHDGHPA